MDMATTSTAFVGMSIARDEFPHRTSVPSPRNAMHGRPESPPPPAAMAITFVTEAGICTATESCCWLFVMPQATTGVTASVTFVLTTNPTALLTAAQ